MTDDTVLDFVTRYMTAVGHGDIDAIAGLFARDAVFYHPLGVAIGHESIIQFYTDVFAQGGLPARPGPAFANGRELLFEIYHRDGPAESGPFAMDHVTLDEYGRAIRLVAMIRPGGQLPASVAAGLKADERYRMPTAPRHPSNT